MVRFLSDEGMNRWLAEIMDGLEWDRGNLTKNRDRHGVEAEEVEDLFTGGETFHLGRVAASRKEPRWIFVGRTSSGRLLTLIATTRGSKLRPISCRPMKRKERRTYEERASKTKR